MYPNQLPGFLPSTIVPLFSPGVLPAALESQNQAARYLPPAQIGDIYQAARQRAVEEHELDKLFNAEYYGDSF
jgi:hypothetical protein